MAVSKAQTRAFFGGGSKPTITDAQFDKIAIFINAETGIINPGLTDFADYVYDVIRERVEDKIHSMAQDQLSLVDF